MGVVTGDAAAVPSSEAFWAARRFLEALARERPLLVVLDDVHWAEPTLLDLVEYIAGWSEAPIAVLALARPELIEARPAWANGAVVLEPLADAAARALLDALPERALIEDDAVGTMLDSADGNPLFLEQIAAFAAERPLAPGEVPRRWNVAREPARSPLGSRARGHRAGRTWSDASSRAKRSTHSRRRTRSPPSARA